MKLQIRNVAKLQSADIDIAGITVIAGENDTGKSTVGKVLYSVLGSLRKLRERAQKDRFRSITRFIGQACLEMANLPDERSQGLEAIADKIGNNREIYISNKTKLKNDIKDWFYGQGFDLSAELADSIVNNVYSVLRLSDEDYKKTILDRKLNTEFNRQVNNIFQNGSADIYLENGTQQAKAIVTNNSVEEFESNFEYKPQLIYIDNPFALDEANSSDYIYTKRLTNHKEELIQQLSLKSRNSNVFEELVLSNNMECIQNKLDSVCQGEVVRDNKYDWQYRIKGNRKSLNVNSLSAGLKTFVILKQLIMSGTLTRGSCVILDEPEIHLHPEWQLVLAELIVLLYKEFDLDILMNTHSPYFLNAVEVYSAKHGVADVCRYYLSRNEGSASVIENVTDNIEMIYKRLARPLQVLEDESYDNA